MTKRFQELRSKMSPQARARSEAIKRKLLAELPLQELRHARRLSQEHMAEFLRIKQASVSKLERRTDMYISTLRRYIEAMGGELEIRAHFPEGDVIVKRLGDIEEKADQDDGTGMTAARST